MSDDGELRKTYLIPEDNIPKMKNMFERINKRARKLGFAPMVAEIGEPIHKQIILTDEFDGRHNAIRTEYPVTVIGEQPILSGWIFLGKIDHLTKDGANVIKGTIPKQYVECPPNCDHCEVLRKRTTTYILEEKETGEFKQVGKSCLSDFFNGDNPLGHMAMLECISKLVEEMDELEEYESGFGSKISLDVEEVLACAAAFVRVHGWVSAAAAEEEGSESSGSMVKRVMLGKVGRDETMPAVTPDDVAKAAQVVGWLLSEETLAKKADSDYMHNLCTIAEVGMVGRTNIGIIASAVNAHERYVGEKLEKEAAPDSHYVGTVDGKVEELPIKIIGKKVITGGQWGDKMLYRMIAGEGDLLVWFSTGAPIGNVGDSLHINATVALQDEYKGTRQTTLQRVTTIEQKLFAAVQSDKPVAALKKLQGKRVNLDHSDVFHQRTPLMEAAHRGNEEVLRWLLERGAATDRVDGSGWAAAHYCAIPAKKGCFDALVEFGASLDVMNTRMETPRRLMRDKMELANAATSMDADLLNAVCLRTQEFLPIVSELRDRDYAYARDFVQSYNDVYRMLRRDGNPERTSAEDVTRTRVLIAKTLTEHALAIGQSTVEREQSEVQWMESMDDVLLMLEPYFEDALIARELMAAKAMAADCQPGRGMF